MTQYRALVVEDDLFTRQHLVDAVASDPRLEVAAQAATLAEARAASDGDAPIDVAVVDLNLPDGSGIDLIRELREANRVREIMVISVLGDHENVTAALAAGATGYLLKDETPAEIGDAIIQLLEGGAPISPGIARHLVKRFQKPAPDEAQQASVTLTQREHQILDMAAKGFSFPETAELLDCSLSTVKSHVKRIYEKLAVHSRAEAVYEGTQLGLVSFDR